MNRTLKAAAVGALAALCLTACSDPGSDSSQSSGPESWPSATTNLNGVELTMWAAQSSASIPQQVAANFNKATGGQDQDRHDPRPLRAERPDQSRHR